MFPAVFALLPWRRQQQGQIAAGVALSSRRYFNLHDAAVLCFRLRDPAFSDRTQPGASSCWIYAEPTSRPTAPAAVAFHPQLSSARHPRPPGWNTPLGCPGTPTAVPAAGYRRCLFLRAPFQKIANEFLVSSRSPGVSFVRSY